MKRTISAVILIVIFLPLLLHAQLDKIVIPAGTPEDKALQAISNEPDAQKKLTMYEGFVQEFASNPAAVAYGNWQISQHYQTASDLQKALEYGDKALASSPHNLDILVSQANVAQQMKNNGKVIDYALRGGEAYNSINKEAKPEGMSDQDFALRLEEEKNAAKSCTNFWRRRRSMPLSMKPMPRRGWPTSSASRRRFPIRASKTRWHRTR